MNQKTFTDMEYSLRKKKNRWEEFSEIMDEIIFGDELVDVDQHYASEWQAGPPANGYRKC